ncbi:MAG: M23 family metallopeptidase [Candidatus Cloacimonas sp.]|nr:M23 family metallopeptidase [Candidatus Cloacimonadota bacterium]
MNEENKKLQKMKRLIPVFLLVILFFQWWKINTLKRQLTNIVVFDRRADSLYVSTGLDYNHPTNLFTSDFINKSFLPSSPFNDGLTFAELKQKYLKYGKPDLYGSPRRTGNIRRIHEGIDFTVPENTPVYPVFPFGIVTEISNDPDHSVETFGYQNGNKNTSLNVGYGKIVRILYPEGIESIYAHLNDVYVEVGQFVDSETVVGITGYTGNIKSSGKPSHLHLELRDKEGNSFDPDSRLRYSQIDIEHFIEKYIEITKK